MINSEKQYLSMRLLTLFFFFFLAGASVANSSPQEKTVTGTVTDYATGEPLPGVNVLIESTLTGVSTDLTGKFSLPKPANGAIITFSSVGFSTERVTYSGQSVLDIKLSQAVLALDDVVVIGYGTIKKSDLTGSIASVRSKEIEKASPDNIQSALQGRVVGLMITSSSGAPASEPIIRLRGIGTVNNNNPIYVVDGMLIDAGSDNASNISFLNPWDIASVEVLKDASAQAIYGSRGANGVILITTRKGTEGFPKVSFSSTIGFNSVTRAPEVLNRDEFMDYIYSCYNNGYIRTHPGTGPNIPVDILINEYPTVRNAVAEYNTGTYTDWYKEVLRTNVVNQNYNFQINGGTKYSHYLASAGYLFNDGLIDNYGYKRYSFRLNTDFKAGKYITFGENLGVTSGSRRGYKDSAGSFQGAMFADPLAPVLKPEGEIDETAPNYEYNKYAPSLITEGNPALAVELINVKDSRLTLVGNMFAEVSILKDLKFRSSYGFNLAYSDQSDYAPTYYLSPKQNSTVSTLTTGNYRTNGWVWENTLTYNKTFKDHSITALIGYTSEHALATVQTASKQQTPNNDPEMQTFDAAISAPNVQGTYNINTMISYLARINYSFRAKYFLTASLRRDGSSKFGYGYRWGTFPAFSVGWNISEEKFLKNNRNGFISNLKLRAGWGQIGNSNLPVYYAYVSQVSSAFPGIWWVNNRYLFAENVYTGYYLSTIGTPDISWETSEQANFGIDFAILKNSLSVTADYFIKNTKDMLLQVPYPVYAGYPGNAAPYTNAGSMQNKGFELVVEYRGSSGDFSYSAAVNFAMFKNKVTSLGNGDKPIIYNVNRTEVGMPVGSFYGFVTNGIFQTEEEVQNYVGPGGKLLQPVAHAGDFRFKNLNDDDAIDASDQTWIGNPWPKLTYGANITLGYKVFDMLVFFQGSYGNKIYDSGIARHLDFQGSYNELMYIYKDAWRGEGTSETQPLLTTVDNNDNYRSSDYFVENGSYMRLKNLQIGYNLPKEICEKIKVTSGRIWIGGTNLVTFTKYRGIDPEVGAAGAPTATAGYDPNNLFPQSRELLIGITISF
jgi:TonB-dependent starch-binding outer membrane protein SusC